MIMLRIGGYINIVIAILHILCLTWADSFFKLTGVGEDMSRLEQINPFLPYLLTVFVAIIFFIFGLYGLSAHGDLKQLIFLKPAIFGIAIIYVCRGLLGLFFTTNGFLGIIYSLIALFIGLLYFIGGFKKWKA